MKIYTPDFNLQKTIESGQVFGYTRENGHFVGNLFGRPTRLRQEGDELFVDGHEPAAKKRVREYFDLDRDLNFLYSILKEEVPLRPALDLRGLRLIRQDPWEAMACFIISSNNNIKRIQGIWKNLVQYFAKRRRHPGSEVFPTAKEIASSHESILRELGLGYRAPFLLHSAKFVAANPETLQCIREAGYEEAKQRVISFPGIGPKVADCVLLYGFQKYDAFPVDVWVLRAMRKHYFRNRRVAEAKVHAFGQKRWGKHAGYVQQYLFFGAKSGIL